MVAPLEQRPIAPVLALPEPSYFTCEKVTRMALRILASLCDIARLFLCAYILTGGISLWHIFTVLGISVLSDKCWTAAKEIIDLKDPGEVEELRKEFRQLDMSKMLEKYPVDTIIRLNLVRLDDLRVNFAMSCHWPTRFPILRQHADALLAARIITQEMHRLLMANDRKGLEQMLPNNTIALERMFQV